MRYVRVLAIAFVLSMLIVNPYLGSGEEGGSYGTPLPTRIRMSHPPISISGDADFASQASSESWPGTGSETDPYIISSLEINASGSYNGISITGTTVHFIIHDCLIIDADDGSIYPTGTGIYFGAVQNGTVRDCILERCRSNGIRLYRCSYTSIIGTSAMYSPDSVGINVYLCEDISIEGCTASGDSLGIKLEESTDSTVRNSTFSHNGYHGMEIYYSTDLDIEGNRFADNGEMGVYIRSRSYRNEFHENTFANCSFGLVGDVDVFRTNHIPVDNTVNGLPVYQINDHHGSAGDILSWEAGQIIFGNVTDVTISDVNISRASEAIVLGHCARITVNDSQFPMNERGVEVVEGHNITIENCTFTDCGRLGTLFEGTVDAAFRWNRVSGSEYGLYAGDNLYRLDAYENEFADNGFGIVLGGATDCRIHENDVRSPLDVGIALEMVWSSEVSGNRILAGDMPPREGIGLLYVQDTRVAGNTIFGPKDGIAFYSSSGCEIFDNTVDGCMGRGLLLLDSDNLSVEGNLFYRCAGRAIMIEEDHIVPENNLFMGNAFLFNNGSGPEYDPSKAQAEDPSGGSEWDRSPGGNHWSDLTSPDADGDGIVDAYYMMAGGAIDGRPLVDNPLLLASEPLGLEAEAGRTRVTISWQEPLYTRSRQISGYVLYRSTNGSEPELLVETTGLSFEDEEVESGTEYGYSVRAMNRYGAGLMSGTVVAVPDSDGPVVNITSPGDGAYLSIMDVELAWEGSDDVGVVGYSYRLDGGNWTDAGLSTNVTLSNVSESVHAFEVMAFDGIGNNGTDSLEFTVDRTAPSLVMVRPSEGVFYGNSTMTAEWSGSDPNLEMFRYSLDGGPWTDTDVTTADLVLSDGIHELSVLALDRAGNVANATVGFSVDTAAPTVTILEPAEGAEFEGRPVNVTWAADGTGSRIVKYLTQLDSGTIKDWGSATTITLMGLTKGDHVFGVMAIDEAGNRGSATVNFSVREEVPEPPPEGKVAVFGTVLDEDGDPIRKVKVVSDTGEETFTDSEGAFYLEVPQGMRTLTFSKKGFHTYDKLVDARGNGSVILDDIALEKRSEPDTPWEWWETCLCCAFPLLFLLVIIVVLFSFTGRRRRRHPEE